MIDPRESSETYAQPDGRAELDPLLRRRPGRRCSAERTRRPPRWRSSTRIGSCPTRCIAWRTRPLPRPGRPPRPPGSTTVFQNRNLERTQFRTQAAWRWLTGRARTMAADSSPSRLAACWRSRTPASRSRASPTTPTAFRVLTDAYRWLTLQETALLAGIPLTPENQQRILAINPPPGSLDAPIPPAGHRPQLRHRDDSRAEYRRGPQ